MAVTIYTDSIGNKYIGYAGDITALEDNTTVRNELVNLLESFSGVTATLFDFDTQIKWGQDGNNFILNVNEFVRFAVRLRSDLFESTLFVDGASFDGVNSGKAVAMTNGVGLGWFQWELDGNNNVNNYNFLWAGEVKGNSNISAPQTRSAIYISSFNANGSIGVKEEDSTTKRIHLRAQAGASHNIDCGTDTGRLYLIEDDGSGGDGGTVGYCENLYISKNPNLTIGGFVTLNNIIDGGSEQAVVVGNWGTDAKILMRVYDGVN